MVFPLFKAKEVVMVDAGVLVGGAVFLIAAVVIFRIVQSVFKAVVFALALTSILAALFVGLLVIDANSMRERLAGGERVLLVSDGKSIVNGAVLGENLSMLSGRMLADYELRMRNQDFSDTEIVFVVKGGAGSGNASLLAAADLLTSPLGIVRAVRADDITIYPRPLALRLLDYLPLSIAVHVLKGVLGAAGSLASQVVEHVMA